MKLTDGTKPSAVPGGFSLTARGGKTGACIARCAGRKSRRCEMKIYICSNVSPAINLNRNRKCEFCKPHITVPENKYRAMMGIVKSIMYQYELHNGLDNDVVKAIERYKKARGK